MAGFSGGPFRAWRSSRFFRHMLPSAIPAGEVRAGQPSWLPPKKGNKAVAVHPAPASAPSRGQVAGWPSLKDAKGDSPNTYHTPITPLSPLAG